MKEKVKNKKKLFSVSRMKSTEEFKLLITQKE